MTPVPAKQQVRVVIAICDHVCIAGDCGFPCNTHVCFVRFEVHIDCGG